MTTVQHLSLVHRPALRLRCCRHQKAVFGAGSPGCSSRKQSQRPEIPRELTLLWNVIPWWNGRRAVKRLELLDGARRVFELIHLLRSPRAVALVGSKAAEARSY